MDFEYHPQFFTATIFKWKHLLKEDKYKLIVLQSMRFMVLSNRFKVFAYVIMPNHIHILWQILAGYKLENVQRDFLKYTAQQIKFDLVKNNLKYLSHFEVNAKDRRFQFWQRNSLCIELFTEKVFIQKINYIHDNPLQYKWQLSGSQEEYQYSSAKFYETGIDEFNFLTHYLD